MNFDVIVIGGGPAGSTAAALVAMQGHQVLLLERERFPRYHIGESLLPATVHGICEMLDVGEEIRQANFVTKRGGTFRWGKSPEPWTFAFAEASPGTQRPAFAYQVERSKFDEILLRNAARKGASVREGCTVKGVSVEDGRTRAVHFEDEDRRQHTARARFVVDASGAAGVLSSQIGERVYDPFFRNVALFGYFNGARRAPEPDRRGNIICAAFDRGWIWFIPLSDELTSVGVVVSSDTSPKLGHSEREQAYADYSSACPMIADLLAPATRVRDGQCSSVRVLKDFSYANTRFWAPGAVLVGDSACFIDPVFSSGVHLATYSGLLAARSINTCLAPARNELPGEERCFVEFERRYRREYGVFYELLLGFYDMHQDEQSYFWRARKVLEVTDAARPAFVRLVAGLSNPGEPLFDDAEAFLRSASDRAHFLQRLSDGTSSGNLPAELHDQARDFGKVFFRERKELWEVRQRKARGAPLADDQAPIWEGGLTPTPDGFHWRASV